MFEVVKRQLLTVLWVGAAGFLDDTKIRGHLRRTEAPAAAEGKMKGWGRSSCMNVARPHPARSGNKQIPGETGEQRGSRERKLEGKEAEAFWESVIGDGNWLSAATQEGQLKS